MRIALAQFDPVVGDIAGNTAKMSHYIAQAKAAGAGLVVFSELSIIGYPPRDLLRKEQFVADNLAAALRLAGDCRGIAALVGYARPTPGSQGRPLQNVAALLADGEIKHVHVKSLLPTYDVFDEHRYFEPGGSPGVIQIDGLCVGLSICEDLWDAVALGRQLYGKDPIADLAGHGARVIINMAASPFQMGKATLREDLFARQARRCKAAIVYVNQVGGNDELIFDGASCVVSPEGHVVARAASFAEDLLVVDLPGNAALPSGRPQSANQEIGVPSLPIGRREELGDDMERLSKALKLGLKDYVAKCGFKSVVLGLSGGIDSTIVATLAADALGPKNVYCLAMPSRYSSDHSIGDSEILARNLGVNFEIVPIKSIHDAFEQSIGPLVASGRGAEVAAENIQARIRGCIVMAYSNSFGHLALATGNKSELSTGYCTLYGDMCGGLAPIGDVLKTLVFKLAHQLNKEAGFERIPLQVINKPPSAELRPNQFDQDKLPPYDLLDAIIEQYVEADKTPQQIIDAGFDATTVQYVIRLVDLAEYKRKQAPQVLKATARAFGSGRRMPIAQRYGVKAGAL